ncbi:type II toxin-antitoxin system RelE/ParE family toxin [Iodobacter fluviatilis]|jgi:proteic killer suppression protein|uniref:Plasmid maintenance system killer protein n=1 Tax=Iodobacter fluviatilis TaxID=537 RepID=A0A377QA20_9NEIS|nr:type II toxin-antitoxin system RelE/ParE family toxin [Iodobacter fluviatilis]TCU81216.1 proteic killer suppression protein [Iodobacter fluviatilis]STQ91732.1 Plasmid maintenance system killer protein [Iodobacter fluviatilis]
MIKTFNHKGLEAFFLTGSKAGIRPDHASKLRLLLARLDTASGAPDMNVPSWRLHPLKGDLTTHWAVTVNGNWRLTFRFLPDGNVELVNYQDYH